MESAAVRFPESAPAHYFYMFGACPRGAPRYRQKCPATLSFYAASNVVVHI